MKRYKDWLINIGLILFGLLIFFSAFEAVVRLDLVGSKGAEICYKRGGSSFHPAYGIRKAPNSVKVRENVRGEKIIISQNSEGFRDTYDSGNRTAVVLGDSFTYGVTVSDKETFPFLLDKWAPNTSFKNYGMSSFGPDQQLALYRNISPKIDHDLVILAYYLGNDAEDALDGDRRAPKFEIRSEGPVLVRKPSKDFRGGLITNPVLDRIQNFIGKRLDSYGYVNKLIRSAVISKRAKREPPSGENLKRHINLTGALIEGIRNEAVSNNASFLITVIPERGEIRPNEPQRYHIDQGKPFWKAQRKMLEEISRRPETRLLDLKPLLKKSLNDSERLYGVKNAHFNSQGYRFMAKEIYKELSDIGYMNGNRDIDFSKKYSRDAIECPSQK